jgi:hypothetical protein
VKRAALYAACLALMLGLLAWLAVMFAGRAGRDAIWASASLAFLVQMIAFMVVRLLPAEQVMIGWGLGAILRLASVVVWGVFVAKVWRMPIVPALVSYAGFLFVTTLVEPVFLRR